MNPVDLPICEIRDRIAATARECNRLIIRAPTGSGKSTQVPQILADEVIQGRGQVVILQPRRLAARLLAARVAHERGCRPGSEVGYQVRFSDCSSRETRIKYITEGILLRRTLVDSALEGTAAVILDEFHERHIYTDVTLGRLLEIQKTTRPDLKIVVMSATLDIEPLRKLLDPCLVLESEGRTYPVEIEHLQAEPDWEKNPPWALASQVFEEIAPRFTEGDALVFMPGAFEIARTVRALRASAACRGWEILPLHGEMPEKEQDRAVGPSDRRKIIVATNVAETSITIDGMRLVIDSGLARMPKFDPRRGINTLLTEKISRSSADQRAGRAGRTAPGRCVRLWTAATHRQRPQATTPEIERMDLSEILLLLKASDRGMPEGVDSNPLADIRSLPWLDQPPVEALDQSLRLLCDLGALDGQTGAITGMGRQLAQFPAHPRFARMLLEAGKSGCVRSAAWIAALVQERSLLSRRPDSLQKEKRDLRFDDESDSDFFRLMQAASYAEEREFDVEACSRLGIHAASARRAAAARDHFLRIASEAGIAPQKAGDEDRTAARKSLLAGFPDHVARRLDSGSLRCVLAHGRRGTLARESVVNAPMFVAAEIQEREVGRSKVDVLLSLCTAVEEEWLRELFPGDIRQERLVSFDDESKRVTAELVTSFLGLPIRSKADTPAEDEAARILADEVIKGNLALKGWSHAVEQLIARINTVASSCPDTGISRFTEDHRRRALEKLCTGAFNHKDIKDRDAFPSVRNVLSREQQDILDNYAPERIKVAGDRQPKIIYSNDSPPRIEARIQELYGTEGPLLAGRGRIPVVIHVLAPNQRPVQITQDLSKFWRDDYPRIKRELQKKYPKHEWR